MKTEDDILVKMDMPVTGAGGGGKGKGSKPPTEAPNTLQSKSVVRLLELLGEGPINGFKNATAAKSVILNPNSTSRTPLMSAGGQFNFAGATFDYRLGEPDQTPIKGFDSQVSPSAVGVPVEHGGDPVANAVIRRVSDLDAAACRVTMQVESLLLIDEKTGDQNGYSVIFAIDVKPDADNVSSTFSQVVYERLSGKTTSPWQKAYRIPLTGVGPWDIRVRRLSIDETSIRKQNDISWQVLDTILEFPVSYPNSVLAALTADTEQFGTSIPTRGYEIEGLLIEVPSNYDPVARTYDGIWDGTFQTAYSNCPPWVYRDMLVNNRYGLGDLFPPALLDVGKWDLYNIAKYCDAWNARSDTGSTDDYDPVTGLHGVPDGAGGFQPRFTFNGTFNTRYTAYEALGAVLGMMRTAMVWSGGQLRFIQDSPSQPRKVFSPANVINGLFNYSGTALRARHTAIKVTYKNADNNFEVEDVLLEDPDAIARYGYNLKEETAFGCTNLGQATRHARNILYTESLETDSVQFRIGIGELDVLPGEVVYIEDPTFTQAEWAGRLADHTLNTVTFDRPIDFEVGRTYTLTVVLEDGTLSEINFTNPEEEAQIVTLAVPFDVGNQPVKNAMFVVSSDVRTPRQFRIITMAEEEDDASIRILAIEHEPDKYLAIDEDVEPTEEPYSDLPGLGECEPPTNLTLDYVSVRAGDSSIGVLEIDWEPSPDFYLQGYVVEYQQGFDEWIRMPLTSASNARIVSPKMGPIFVRVYAVNLQGKASQAISADIDISTGNSNGKDLISNLQVKGGGVTWIGPDLHVEWTSLPIYGIGEDQDDGKDQFFKAFRVRLLDPSDDSQLATFTTKETNFIFAHDVLVTSGLRAYKVAVSLLDINGTYSNEAVITATNPAPSFPTVPVVQAGLNAIILYMSTPADPDFDGFNVYMSLVDGFTPDPANLVWTGKSDTVVLPQLATGVPHYLRAYPKDPFGEGTGTAQLTATPLDISGRLDELEEGLDEISADGMLTPTEKRIRLIPANTELANIYVQLTGLATQLGIVTEADAATAAKLAWETYRDALDPAWDDLTQSTPIDRVEFDGYLEDYIESLEALDTAIKLKASQGIVTTRWPEPAPYNVLEGSLYFDEFNRMYRLEFGTLAFEGDDLEFYSDPLEWAGYVLVQDKDLRSMIEALQSVDNDGLLTIDEKIRIVIPEDNRLEAAYQGLLSQATALGISVATLTAARNAWIALRDSLDPAWNNTTVNTPITRADWDSILATYRTEIEQARALLQNAASVTASYPPTLEFGFDANGNLKGGQVPVDTYIIVKRGSIVITLDDEVDYAITPSANITATVENTDEDPDKGTITITDVDGEGYIDITVTVDGVALPVHRVAITTKEDSVSVTFPDSQTEAFSDGTDTRLHKSGVAASMPGTYNYTNPFPNTSRPPQITLLGNIGQSDESDEIWYVSSYSVNGFTLSVSGDYTSFPSVSFDVWGT